MADIINYHDKLTYIRELLAELEFREYQSAEVQRDCNDGERRIADLNGILKYFLYILQETRKAGPGIDPDIENEYINDIISSMIIVQPEVPLETTGIGALELVEITLPIVTGAIERSYETLHSVRLSISEELRNLVETIQEIHQKIAELPNDIRRFDDIRIFLDRFSEFNHA